MPHDAQAIRSARMRTALACSSYPTHWEYHISIANKTRQFACRTLNENAIHTPHDAAFNSSAGRPGCFEYGAPRMLGYPATRRQDSVMYSPTMGAGTNEMTWFIHNHRLCQRPCRTLRLAGAAACSQRSGQVAEYQPHLGRERHAWARPRRLERAWHRRAGWLHTQHRECRLAPLRRARRHTSKWNSPARPRHCRRSDLPQLQPMQVKRYAGMHNHQL